MTKTDIIEAAFKVWGREYYFNTSLSLLASELKVCKPALYRHFISKNALFDAMTKYFYDDFTAFLREDYLKALQNKDKTESIFIMIRSVTKYYALNRNNFIYAMIKLNEHKTKSDDISHELRQRGIDFRYLLDSVSEKYTIEPLIMRLIFVTLTFYMAGFHKMRKNMENQSINPIDDTLISVIIGEISEILGCGLGYTREEIDSLDYDKLESQIAGTADNIIDDPLLKAVAGAVAEAGPWEASMEQVARRSGLSKSSLYCHFKDRQDMLHQLFLTEFKRIIEFARQGIGQSQNPIEQLYLGIFSIAEYLRSKPDILITFDWIRNRKLNFNPGGKKHTGPEFESLRLFDEIDIKPLNSENPFQRVLSGDEKISLSAWILFLIVNTLMRKNDGQELGKAANSDIRNLYRLITIGVGGFEKMRNEE